MDLKFLIFAGLLLASTQALPREEIDVAELERSIGALDTIGELLQRIRDLIEEIEENRPEIPEWVPEPLIDFLKELILNIEIGNVTVGEIVCVVRHIDELLEQIQIVGGYSQVAVGLLQQRHEEVKACREYGGFLPSPSELIERIRCVREVERSTGQLAASAVADLSWAIVDLMKLEREVRSCLN